MRVEPTQSVFSKHRTTAFLVNLVQPLNLSIFSPLEPHTLVHFLHHLLEKDEEN